MHILLTGGTGLIGRQLCRLWLQQGHRLTVWSRRPEEVAKICGTSVRGVARLDEIDEPVDAVVNLAGAPIADRPWSHKRKMLLWSSRITLTEVLLAWLGRCEQKPQVLISGSAVGWYGDGGERELTEESGPVSEDFASQLCIAWEETAQRAEALACAWCWCVPAWSCLPRAAFCRGCCCRSNWRWAGVSAMVGSGCHGFILTIKSP